MQNIKLIAIDLDGTLYDEQKRISDRNLSALRQAAGMGVYVVIATGRIYLSAKAVSSIIAPGQPYLSSNGAVAGFSDRDSFLHVYTMADEDVLFAIQAALDNACDLHLHTMDGCMLHLDTPSKRMQYAGETLAEGAEGVLNKMVDLESMKKLCLGQTLKMVVMQEDAARLDAFRQQMRTRHVTMASSWSNNEEVMAVGADKGSGLRSLIRILGIPAQQVMVLGDHLNDLSMFRVAGLPVAMGNAADEVKAAAKAVTLDNEHSGVACAVEKYVL